MEYSKSNNRKGLEITTGTNVCKVKNWSLGLDEFLQSPKDKESLLKLKESLRQRHEAKKELLQLGQSLLQKLQIQRLQSTEHGVYTGNNGYLYKIASKPKNKQLVLK